MEQVYKNQSQVTILSWHRESTFRQLISKLHQVSINSTDEHPGERVQWELLGTKPTKDLTTNYEKKKLSVDP